MIKDQPNGVNSQISYLEKFLLDTQPYLSRLAALRQALFLLKKIQSFQPKSLSPSKDKLQNEILLASKRNSFLEKELILSFLKKPKREDQNKEKTENLSKREIKKILKTSIKENELIKALIQAIEMDMQINFSEYPQLNFYEAQVIIADYYINVKNMKTVSKSDTVSQELFLKRKEYWAEAKKSLAQVRSRRTLSTGIEVMQFMFQGDIFTPGVGNSGGLAVILKSLGDALAANNGVNAVYTVVFSLNAGAGVIKRLRKNHILIVLPIPPEKVETPVQKSRYYNIIFYHLQKYLEWLKIEPDIFHLRFFDSASMAALNVAKLKQIKIVTTVSLDPHRELNKQMNLPVESQDISFQEIGLQRMEIADQIVNDSDFGVALSYNSLDSEVISYFPKLVEKKTNLVTVSEGVVPSKRKIIRVADFLKNNYHRYTISDENMDLPQIINVGRFAPVKQQGVLLKAWINKKLYKSYNLVLIGGNYKSPTQTERALFKEIFEIIESNPEVTGRIAIIPAVPNYVIRSYENALGKSGVLNFFVSSSFREEGFGIAILEAMSAGLVAFVPLNGAPKSYINHGINGFILDTGSEKLFAEQIDEILGQNSVYKSHQLKLIAKRGKKYVNENLNISNVSEQYFKIYKNLLANKIP